MRGGCALTFGMGQSDSPSQWMRTYHGAPPSGVLRMSRFFPEETVMSLSGEICPACGLWG